ncbi:MAG: hypothetical protein V7K40_33510 [Nostoc sp.]
MREATDWSPLDATPSTFYLSADKSGYVNSFNDGSLVEIAPSGEGGSTSWSYPDPKWMAGVTAFDINGVPEFWAR